MAAKEFIDAIGSTFTMERKTKDQFADLCDEIGISISAAVNALIEQAIRQQGMSFSLLEENGSTQEGASEIKRRIVDVRAGNVEEHPLIEA